MSHQFTLFLVYLLILLASFIIESGEIGNFCGNKIKLNFHFVDCCLQESIFEWLFFEFVSQVWNGLFQGAESNFFYVFEFEENEGDFEFEDFGSFEDEFELFVEECIFEVLEIHFFVILKLKLVRSVISEGIDDEFVFLLYAKGEGHVELLVLGIADDTWGHGD